MNPTARQQWLPMWAWWLLFFFANPLWGFLIFCRYLPEILVCVLIVCGLVFAGAFLNAAFTARSSETWVEVRDAPNPVRGKLIYDRLSPWPGQ